MKRDKTIHNGFCRPPILLASSCFWNEKATGLTQAGWLAACLPPALSINQPARGVAKDVWDGRRGCVCARMCVPGLETRKVPS